MCRAAKLKPALALIARDTRLRPKCRHRRLPAFPAP